MSATYKSYLKHPGKWDKLPFEMVQNRFCKFLFGLKGNSSNYAIKAELGKGPIWTFICTQVLRYWIKLEYINEDRILKQAYLEEKKSQPEGPLSQQYNEKPLAGTGLQPIH